LATLVDMPGNLVYSTDMTTTEYPISKFGARWVVDGPRGRFHTRTKREAEAQLAEDIEKMTCPECGGPLTFSVDGSERFLFHIESTDCAPDPWPTW
jgi:hypothetical protein